MPTLPGLQKLLENSAIMDHNGLETLIHNPKITTEAHQGQITDLHQIEIGITIITIDPAPAVAVAVEVVVAITPILEMVLLEEALVPVIMVSVVVIITPIIEMALLLTEEDQEGVQMIEEIIISIPIIIQIIPTIIDFLDLQRGIDQILDLEATKISNKIDHRTRIQITEALKQGIDQAVVVVAVVAMETAAVEVVEVVDHINDNSSNVLQVDSTTATTTPTRISNNSNHIIGPLFDLESLLPAPSRGGKRIKCKKNSKQRSRRSMLVRKCRRG